MGKNLGELLADISRNWIEATKTDIPQFKWDIPQIELGIVDSMKEIVSAPILEAVKSLADSADIAEETMLMLIQEMAKKGWTLTDAVAFAHVSDPEILDMSSEALDSYFVEIYNSYLYEEVKNYTCNYVEKTQKPLLKEVYKAVDSEMYLVAIPSLILIIEGEMSTLIGSTQVGKRLFKEWNQKLQSLDSINDRFLKAQTLALYEYTKEQLFQRDNFSRERRDILNRHRVMHGRDDSKQWSKVDVYKLINLLQTLVEVKEIAKESVA